MNLTIPHNLIFSITHEVYLLNHFRFPHFFKLNQLITFIYLFCLFLAQLNIR